MDGWKISFILIYNAMKPNGKVFLVSIININVVQVDFIFTERFGFKQD